MLAILQQAADQQAPADDTSFALLSLFTDGGFMMYPLLLCSLIALGVIIAKGWMIWVAHRESSELLEEVEDLAQAGHLDRAIDLAEETPGPVAAVLLTGLRRVREQQGDRDVESAINTTGTIELDFLERGLPVLATIANIAPMLGFLGTVIGMILAFAAIEQAGQVEPALVAGGIKVALITTATGLAIAIPVNVAYHFFVSRVDRLITSMEEGAQAVLDMIWRLEAGGAGPRGGAASERAEG